MKITSTLKLSAVALSLAGFGSFAQAQSFSQGFNGTAVPSGWTITNLSTGAATGNPWGVAPAITDANGNPVVTPREGNGFALSNYTSIPSGSGTINNWLISPEIFGIKNGDVFSFYTTTTPASAFPDRLEFRLSSAGAGVNVGATTTSVGTFDNTLASVNSTLAVGGYPTAWSLVSVTMSGLAAPVDGRVAFRYFVTSGGPSGANSNIIGVDDFKYVAAAAVPEPATWAMTLGGVGALLAWRRRKSAQA